LDEPDDSKLGDAGRISLGMFWSRFRGKAYGLAQPQRRLAGFHSPASLRGPTPLASIWRGTASTGRRSAWRLPRTVVSKQTC
jgi:hypothetical protein